MCSLAVLDTIMSPEWQYRYFSFDKDWSPTQRMGSMRDGSGDELHAVFSEEGAVVLGHAHEYPQPEHLIAEARRMLPAEFVGQLDEPAFSVDTCRFILWASSDSRWSSVCRSADDGSRELLKYYMPDPAVYQKWAEDYYEEDVPLSLIEGAFAHRDIDLVRWGGLASAVSEAEFLQDLKRAGYPMGGMT